jgi:transcriptional regulator with XRE-family HTH domain
MTCVKCGGIRITAHTLPRYEDDGMVGLPNVVILNAAQRFVCDECGEDNGIRILNEEGLEAAVAVNRVMMPLKLIGREIKFLRKAIGLTGKQLAEVLGVQAEETISRWENDKNRIPISNEKMLRVVVGSTLTKEAPMIPFDEKYILVDMRILAAASLDKRNSKIEFLRVRTSASPTWAEPAAA